MKKLLIAGLILLLCTVLLISLVPEGGENEEYRISEANSSNFGMLFSNLLRAYESSSADDEENIRKDLDTIRAVSKKDYAVAKAIADHWAAVYLDPAYALCLYDEGEYAAGLAETGIPNSASHAFVVLGYELQNGEMTEELKGRCDAAAAAARTFLKTILICSGGATGGNNPERHTEAGLMKAYLTQQCGIDAGRIFIDEKAMTTAENAINTFQILQEQNIRTITIVTSSYHQRWGQVIYNGLAALYGQKYGYCPKIVGNYCFDMGPAEEVFRNDAQIAIRQLASVLGVSSK